MRLPGPSSRVRVGAAVVAVVLLAACDSSGSRPVVGGGRDVRDDEVAGRPWPDRVTPSGPWAASVEGTGLRVTLTTGGTVVGGLSRTTVDLGRPDSDRPAGGPSLAFPDGQRWYPQKPFRLEAEGDLPFPPVVLEGTLDSEGAYSLEATGRAVAVRVGFGLLLEAAGGQVTLRGEFVGGDGARVGDLIVPAGTLVVPGCPDPATTIPPVTFPGETPGPTGPCGAESDLPDQPVVVTVDAAEGMTLRASGDGEAAVAGEARAEALGRSWDGLVVALEGRRIEASASYDGRRWSLTATSPDARQVWVDVWPVVDTVLEARSFSTAPGFFDRNRLLRVVWVNAGHATSQIMEAEGVGPGATGVGFDLNKTLGHDAGLDVRRGDQVIGVGGGGDVDSNLAPGQESDRELSYRAGQPATLVLRGNFPEVRIELAVPGT